MPHGRNDDEDSPAASRRLLRVLAVLRSSQLGTVLLDEDLARLRAVADVVLEELAQGVRPGPQWYAELIRAVRPDVLLTSWGTPRLSAEALVAGQGCVKLLVHCAGTLKGTLDPACLDAGLTVTNWGSAISRCVAEGALMLTLAGLRRLGFWQRVLCHQRGWEAGPDGARSLFERRVGLYGYGNIAAVYRSLLRGFGCAVRVYDPFLPAEVFEQEQLERADSLDDLCEASDVLSIHAGLTEQTARSLDARHLALLRDGSLVVNTARGGIVDWPALTAELVSGRLAAALDVFDPHEPLPPDSVLRDLPNVILTPHRAGPTDDRKRDMGRFAVDNILRYARGEPLQAVITADRLSLIT